MLSIDVTFIDESSERIHGVTDWDVRTDGHLVAWNGVGDVVAERDDVATAIYNRAAPDGSRPA